ncbi:hypothetical protein LIER_23536 [Lithospermum erythrorhizon]|uniref:Integrase catalytic domain-containing protein n=1 Tax=Lithospermum erythrorhizon TaxID=34254 RepID=A0AAV3R183_LITER
MVSMLCPIPFYQWGVDIVGDLPRIVEAKPLPRKDQEQVHQFLIEIFTRFGVPWVLVIDNGTQYTVGKIEDLCVELDIDYMTTSVSYPQANGQVEVMNWVIFKADKARVTYYDELANELDLRLNLDLLEGKRAAAFLVGDLVLQARQVSAHGKSGNLESSWEGPYIIRRLVGPVT